jgi:tetratricopeptide (TPR) repeat protein
MTTSVEFLRQGVEAARAGRRAEARNLFLQAVELDQRNELAWMWLTGYVDDLEDKIIACENVLALNPANEKIRAYLASLLTQRVVQPPPPAAPVVVEEVAVAPARQHPQTVMELVAQAEEFEQQGMLEDARITYEVVAAKTKDAETFNRAFREIARLEGLQNEKIVHVPASASLVRMTWTWPLVYVSFVMVQVGLKPWGSGALLWLGLPMVVAGSFLLALSEVKTRHVVWQMVFQEEGSGSTFARWVLAVAGWVFVLLPFGFILVSSLSRLQNFEIPPEPFF